MFSIATVVPKLIVRFWYRQKYYVQSLFFFKNVETRSLQASCWVQCRASSSRGFVGMISLLTRERSLRDSRHSGIGSQDPGCPPYPWLIDWRERRYMELLPTPTFGFTNAYSCGSIFWKMRFFTFLPRVQQKDKFVKCKVDVSSG